MILCNRNMGNLYNYKGSETVKRDVHSEGQNSSHAPTLFSACEFRFCVCTVQFHSFTATTLLKIYLCTIVSSDCNFITCINW